MSPREKLPSGLRLPAHKSRPFERPVVPVPAPATAVIALDQGGGEAAVPVVERGQSVAIGTVVARATGVRSIRLHATVSGVVAGIESRPTAQGARPCILIENDGLDREVSVVGPVDWESCDPVALVDELRAAGIAGLGGAAFPTVGKLAAAREQSVELLLLNGAECEPWICCDDALMRSRAPDVVAGARVMLAACGAPRCTIAIEDDKPEAAEAMAAAVRDAGDPRLDVRVLPALYPLGAERQLVQAVTGREVPSGALPPSVGVVCQNVGTAAALAAFVSSGRPPHTRIVTVTGSAVRFPTNVEARFGTPVSDLLASCGGLSTSPACLIAGGSMTGRTLPGTEVPVTRSLNCVLAAAGDDLRSPGPELPCIRCGECAVVCPVNLLPQQLHHAARANDRPALERLGLRDCIECGCCDYVCPSGIPLTRRFSAALGRLEVHDDERRRAAEARGRFERHERRRIERAEAERLAFEDARRRALDAGPDREA